MTQPPTSGQGPEGDEPAEGPSLSKEPPRGPYPGPPGPPPGPPPAPDPSPYGSGDYGQYGQQQPYGQPYGQAAPYGQEYGQQQPYGGYGGPPQGTNGLAIGSLISGIIGLVACGVLSIVAIVLGHMAMNQIRRTGQDGRGFALGGLILGYVAVAIWLVVLVVVIIAASQSGSSTSY